MTRMLLVTITLMLGCAETHAPDTTRDASLPECVMLAATPHDGGASAHVYTLPNGYPCEGGTCQQGMCVPRRGTGYPDHGPACADGEVCE